MAAIWPNIDWRVMNRRSLSLTEVRGVTYITGVGNRAVIKCLPLRPSQESIDEAKVKLREHLNGEAAAAISVTDDLEYDQYDQDEGGSEERLLPGFA